MRFFKILSPRDFILSILRMVWKFFLHVYTFAGKNPKGFLTQICSNERKSPFSSKRYSNFIPNRIF